MGAASFVTILLRRTISLATPAAVGYHVENSPGIILWPLRGRNHLNSLIAAT
jgi:hypothetical protein